MNIRRKNINAFNAAIEKKFLNKPLGFFIERLQSKHLGSAIFNWTKFHTFLIIVELYFLFWNYIV